MEVGSIWREVKTNRPPRVLTEEVYGTGPAWTYLDGPPGNWQYCDLCDFIVWGRFVKE